MAAVSVTFAVGSEQATVVLPVDLPTGGETILTGDIGGLVAAGTVARLRGACRLIADLHVRGTLLTDPTGVNLDGQNLFDIHTHDGTLNLIGTEKSAWVRWGDVPVGWQTGDRLAVAPTVPLVYTPTETTWQGSWAATARPANSPNVTLVDGSTARPEVVNLSQTVVLRNLKRIMVHEASAPNPQTFKWVKVLNSGEAGVLGMYPIHFHMIGEHARGSVLEGVVVEGGKNHAFVPHASHGITFTECVAYDTTSDAYWWDQPIGEDTTNDSNDVHYLRCGVLKGKKDHGFRLMAGLRNKCLDSFAACMTSGIESSGFHWPSKGHGVWDFTGNVAHNCFHDGIFTWQNNNTLNLIDDFTAYHCGNAGVEHGAYTNNYQYIGIKLTACRYGLESHALTPGKPGAQNALLLFADILSDSMLLIAHHNLVSARPVVYRNCTFPNVVVEEGVNSGYHKFEDCPMTPADFNMVDANQASIVELWTGGVLQDRWTAGVWS